MAVGFIRAKRGRIEQVPRLVGQVGVQADEVALGEQLVHLDPRGIERLPRPRPKPDDVVVQDPHPEARARRAISRPIRPKPTMPSVAPWMSRPSSSIGPHVRQRPART
jgi:hypothetical protein